MRPRPGLHETEAEAETETKKVSRPCWSRDINIPDSSDSLYYTIQTYSIQ